MVLSARNLILTYPENQMIQSWELVVSRAIRLTCLYSAGKTLEEKMLLENLTIILKSIEL